MQPHIFSGQMHDLELYQLREENRLLKERIKELESKVPKWNNLMDGSIPEEGQECIVSDGKYIYLSEFCSDIEGEGEMECWFDACEDCNWWMEKPKLPKNEVEK